jgi:hypothetical protein
MTREEQSEQLAWERYIAVTDRINGFSYRPEQPDDYQTKRMYDESFPEFAERYNDTFCGACGERKENESGEPHICK